MSNKHSDANTASGNDNGPQSNAGGSTGDHTGFRELMQWMHTTADPDQQSLELG